MNGNFRNTESTGDGICPRRLSSAYSALAMAALSLLTGCVSTQTSPFGADAGVSSELYAGEPVALHATEMPVASAEEARSRAREALAQRDVDLALYLYVQAVSLDESDAESFYAIGSIHEDRGNPELAAKAYERAVGLYPDNALARQGLGLALFDARQFDAAEPQLLAAIDRDPSLWRAHNTLGMLADRRQHYALAVLRYSAAIEAQPTLASLRNNRGYSKYLSGDIDAAKQDFVAAIDIDPAYDRAWRNLGLALAREQNFDRALAAMSNAVPEYVALNDVGYVAMLDGDYIVARKFFEDAIIESPRHYQTAQDNLAELNRRSKTQPALVAVD